jgi:hypothetical protein
MTVISHGWRKLHRSDRHTTRLVDGLQRVSGSTHEVYGYLTHRRFDDGSWSVVYHLPDNTFIGEAQGKSELKAEQALFAKYGDLMLWKL